MADDQNDQQAKALIDALAPKLAEAILPRITEHVETQIKGIKEKNDDLISRLQKAKSEAPDMDKLLAEAERQLQERLKGGSFKMPDQSAALTISKADARNPKAYRAAKAEAEKRGVPLQIDGR